MFAHGVFQFLLAKITSPERARSVALDVRAAVLQTLARAVSTQSLALQVYMLGVLRAVVVYSSVAPSDDAAADSNNNEAAAMLLQVRLF